MQFSTKIKFIEKIDLCEIKSAVFTCIKIYYFFQYKELFPDERT